MKFPLELARRLASQVVMALRPYCDVIEVAGSIRRQKAEIGDIEIVCIPKLLPKFDMFQSETGKERHPGFKQAVNQWKFVKGDAAEGKYMQRVMVFEIGDESKEIKIDIFTAKLESWGYILTIRTGSAEFSKYLAECWKKAGYHGDEGYLKDPDDKIIPVETEEKLFPTDGAGVC